MQVRVREFDGLKAAATELSPESLAAINQLAIEPVTADEVTARTMRLCHDQYDRSGERFPRAYLDRFAETLPGKSVLPGHDKSALPLARFHQASVEAVMGPFPVLQTGGKAAGWVEGAPETEVARKKVQYLTAGFYYPKDAASEAFDNRLKAGVYSSASVGFRYDDLNCDLCKKSYLRSDCPHLLMSRTEDGVLVTGTYSGDASKAEAMEGSLVYLGAQPMARVMKSMIEEGTVDPRRLAWTPFGEDLIALKYAEGLARHYGSAVKNFHFRLAEKSAPAGEGENEMNLAAIAKALGLAETATEEQVVAEVGKAKAATETAKTTGADEKAAELKPLVDAGKAALSDLQAAYLGHATRLGRSETEAKAVAELFAGRNDYAGLKKLVDETFAEVCQKFPAGKSGKSDVGEDDVADVQDPNQIIGQALAG